MKLKKHISALSKGFTLVELLVVMGIIAILIGVVVVAVNPGRQFAQARDTQRRNDISAILAIVYQYAADNNGNLPPGITTAQVDVCSATPCAAGLVDLTGLVPTYLSTIPSDPSNAVGSDTKYILFKNGTRVTASASSEVVPGTYFSYTR